MASAKPDPNAQTPGPSSTLPSETALDEAQQVERASDPQTALSIAPVPPIALKALPHLLDGATVDEAASLIGEPDADTLRSALATPQAQVVLAQRQRELIQALGFRALRAIGEAMVQTDSRTAAVDAARYALGINSLVPSAPGRGKHNSGGRDLPRGMTVTLVRKGEHEGVQVRIDGKSDDD